MILLEYFFLFRPIKYMNPTNESHPFRIYVIQIRCGKLHINTLTSLTKYL